jgi:hypothetical protein
MSSSRTRADAEAAAAAAAASQAARATPAAAPAASPLSASRASEERRAFEALRLTGGTVARLDPQRRQARRDRHATWDGER